MFHFGIWSCTRCGWDAGEQIEAEVYGVQDAREPDESEVMDEDDGEID
jgi:ribosomal protein L37AE/L43A